MTKAGKIDISSMKKFVNKKVGLNIAHDLNEDNPTEVKEWIPTGSRWLDSITCRGKMAGIPVGKITELAGLSSSGKSYMACQIASQAQKKGHFVVYFDAESAIDPKFLKNSGIDTNSDFMYIQAVSVEKVLETIEDLMTEYAETQFLFIWDSIAATSAEKDLEGDFNPQSSMAVKPRIFAKAFPKLTIPLANQQCTLLLINQLKTNIGAQVSGSRMMAIPSRNFAVRPCSGASATKASFVTVQRFRIGSEVKVKIEKSRFGSEGRTCGFKILWGKDVGIQDEESWLEALRASGSERFKAGAWNKIYDAKGKEYKFQKSQWITKLQEPEFRSVVLDIMDEEIIRKFESEGKNFSLEGENEEG